MVPKGTASASPVVGAPPKAPGALRSALETVTASARASLPRAGLAVLLPVKPAQALRAPAVEDAAA